MKPLFLSGLLAALTLLGYGVYAFQQISIEAFPDVQDVQVLVVTQAPGQAPEEVERAITLPIEREMSGVPGLTQLRSVSITGLSVVTLTFNEKTADYFARQQVLERLQTVSLPPGIQPVLAPLTTAVGEIYRYVLEAPPNAEREEIRAIQDWTVRPALRMVPGIADVVSFGGAIRELQVQINPELLRKYAISLDDVTQALTGASVNGSGGLMRRGDEALVVRTLGLFNNLDDVRDVVIVARDGKPVRISAKVLALTDGKFRNVGPFENNFAIDVGHTAMFDVEGIKVIVTSNCQTPNDPAYFTLHGIDLNEVGLLCVKAKNHFRAGFTSLTRTIIECDAPGPAAASLQHYKFKHAPDSLAR